MRVQRAYKTELDLTDRQVTACRQHAGAARWAYNWGLQLKQERYRATKTSPTAIELHRELNARKKTQVSWMYQVSKCAPQEALWNAGRPPLAHFFRRCALKQQGKWQGKLGYPNEGMLPSSAWRDDQRSSQGYRPASRMDEGR
jgi:putative transposase